MIMPSIQSHKRTGIGNKKTIKNISASSNSHPLRAVYFYIVFKGCCVFQIQSGCFSQGALRQFHDKTRIQIPWGQERARERERLPDESCVYSERRHVVSRRRRGASDFFPWKNFLPFTSLDKRRFSFYCACCERYSLFFVYCTGTEFGVVLHRNQHQLGCISLRIPL